MYGYHTPPMPGSHARPRKDGTDGATAKFEAVSPAQHAAHSTHYSSPSSNQTANNYLYPGRPANNAPDYSRLLPDYDTRNIVPQPLHSLIQRLGRGAFPPNTTQLSMKSIQTIYKYFKKTFSAERNESWAKHVDSIEAEVFEREDYYPKQCYYASRSTLGIMPKQRSN